MEDYSNFTIQNLYSAKLNPALKDSLDGEDRHMLSFMHMVEF